MTNPILYVDEAAAESYEIVGDDPSERRGWGVRAMADGDLAVFSSRVQAEDHARKLDQGEVVVIIGHAPS
jgi:hypothetical protein